MTKLSPAALTVWSAFLDRYEWEVTTEELFAVAAVLRAAADQVVPEEPHPEESQFWDDEANREWQNNQHFRRQLLSIATELEQNQ